MSYDPKKEYPTLREQDRDVYDAVVGEAMRQQYGLELIPSENYASRAVREALKSELTNKYAEGYPGNRYYGGQKYTDTIERLAIKRVTQLFNAEFANVQPLSGAPANLAAYAALLAPGDTVLGMKLDHGGHLTHGHPVTFAADVFDFVRYGMADTDTGEIDYDQLYETAETHNPELILAGFSAYPRELDYEKFVSIAEEVDAYTMMDAAHIAGLVAGGALANPLEAGFDLMTATTHKTLRGPRGGIILSNDEGIMKDVNKAVFPGVQGGPHMNTIAAKAVSFKEALDVSFRDYGEQIIKNAQAMADVFADAGVRMITGGTSNHLLLIDVIASFDITGKLAEAILDDVRITVNKNILPDDERSPTDPSGIRLGTPALTTRGFQEEDCKQVAEIICNALENPEDEGTLDKAEDQVDKLAKSHPIPDSFS
jgi:glycine hydroxymethyltransferase